MKKILILNLLILIFTTFVFEVYSQNNEDLAGVRIRNEKGVGNIKNKKGMVRVVSNGEMSGMQDRIDGTVAFISKQGSTQVIPNITFSKLIVDTYSPMYIDSGLVDGVTRATTRPMTVLDSFIILNKGRDNKIYNNYVETIARGDVKTSGKVVGKKDMVMDNVMRAQGIASDSGRISRLRVENPNGIDITGDIFIDNKLEMRRGEIRNSDSGRVHIGAEDYNRSQNITKDVIPADSLIAGADSNTFYELNNPHPLVIRYVGTSLAERANFEEQATDLQYKGTGTIYTGGEVPPAEKDIFGLRVENTDSLVLSENVHAVDNMYIATHIHTTDDDTLTLISHKNVEYDLTNPMSEVQGHFRRIGWLDGDTIILNNPYTKLFFYDPIARSEVSTLLSTVFPSRSHDLPESSNNKVKRKLALRAFNANGIEYTDKMNAQYHYGWKYQGSFDETFNLAFNKLLLLHFDTANSKWKPNMSSVVPPTNYAAGYWGYSYAVDVQEFGDFAIGLPSELYHLAFSGKAILEGGYNYFDKEMRNDLQTHNYLPQPPPNVYPYNTDPDRLLYSRPDGQFPDSVVDWVVVEFRKDFAIEGTKKTFLLKTDGRIVDLYGNEQILFHTDGTFIPLDSNGIVGEDTLSDSDAQFYVLIRHRNHAAVVSNKPVQFIAGEEVFVDFTSPANVLGGADALKPVDYIDRNAGIFKYGMIAGDINHNMMPNGVIDSNDYNVLKDNIYNWSLDSIDGYLLEDVSLSGTITSADYNLIWNNRGKLLWYREE